MIFYLIFYLIFILGKSCEVEKDGIYLVEYYRNVKDDLDDLGGDVIKRKRIDCGVCPCQNISTPSYSLFKDGEEVEKELVDLEEKDFYSGFEGPWLILFYSREDDQSSLRKLNGLGLLKVGRVKYSESKYLESRFNIRTYPSYIFMYNGLTVPFLDVPNLPNLVKFTLKLLEPTFTPITLRDVHDNDLLYIVLHRDEKMAFYNFFRFAHNFKFKIKMSHSQDPALFKKANVFPTDKEALVVYKNGSYFPYEGDISDENSIVEWIFHTHFPNVTKISNASFHSIFNGLKPVFLLLTESDSLLDHLESFSRGVHLGKPYLHLIFSSINLDEYVLFTSSLLPKIEIPTFVIYNPYDKKFYHRKTNLNPENFQREAEETLKEFEKGKLKPYAETGRNYYWMAFVFGAIILGVYWYLKRVK